MAKPKLTTLSLCVALLFGAAACGPSLVLEDVDYSQPIESVIAPDDNLEVHDQRYAVKFNIGPIIEEEGVPAEEVRLIRNRAGYYFLTASGFNNVYVFESAESELKLETKIEIGELSQPAFNLRDGNIELVDIGTGETYTLTHEGLR